MKKTTIAFIFILSLFCIENCNAQALIGEISKADYKKQKPQVVDKSTQQPIAGANISVPTENIFTQSDNTGHFTLTPNGKSPVILSIQKDGYRPFSLTLQDGKLHSNTVFEMDRTSPLSIVVTDNMLHLGDDSYSENSAGACQINAPCVGHEFSKDFYIKEITPKTNVYVSIGSVIGIDTLQAMKLGQNKLTNAFSTPMEIFVNKTKIGELKINGDNQKIPIPNKLLKKLANNTLTIKTGKNSSSKDNIDYDDIELMNLIVDIKN